MASKVCRRCNVEKDRGEFGREARYADGLRTWCRQCHREYGRQWAQQNPEKQRERAVKWQAANPEKLAEANRKFKRANKDRMVRARAEWARRNPDKVADAHARRRALKRNAMPPWADRKAIAAVYAEAKRIERATGVKMNVDHIHPLQHKRLCGLHVHWNLQILTAEENQRKKNRFIADEVARPRLPLDDPRPTPVQEAMAV